MEGVSCGAQAARILEVRNSGDTSSLKTGTISEDGFLQTQVLEGEFPK